MRVLSRERVPQLDSVWVYLTLPDLAQKKGKGSVEKFWELSFMERDPLIMHVHCTDQEFERY